MKYRLVCAKLIGKMLLKKLLVGESACDTKQNGFLGKKHCVEAEIYQIIQIFGPY